MTRPGLFAGLESFCKSMPDYDATLAMYTKMVKQIAERMARAKKTGGKKRKGRK